ncbi:hypothetical protein B0H13DRAFT_2337144 [Mycena leptocephala]|nr:hypothetical protein B0H13DRAFT_2337144 [Mycena leptocephala]
MTLKTTAAAPPRAVDADADAANDPDLASVNSHEIGRRCGRRRLADGHSSSKKSTSAKHTTLLAEILVPLLVGLGLLRLLVGAALYRRHKKKHEESAAVPYPYPPMQERGAGAGPWSRLDMALREGSPFVPPLPLMIPGGMDSTDFVGGAGSGSSQTHGVDVPSTAPTVGHGYSNSSLNHSTTAPTFGHGHSNSSVNHSTTNRVTSTLALARVRTHSVSATTGAGHGYGYGYPQTDDGHSDELALAEAESRLTSMDAAPVHGYGVGVGSNNEYGVSSGSGNANDGCASPVYGAEYGGRGMRRCTTLT